MTGTCRNSFELKVRTDSEFTVAYPRKFFCCWLILAVLMGIHIENIHEDIILISESDFIERDRLGTTKARLPTVALSLNAEHAA